MRKHFNLIRRILNQSNLNFIFEKTLIYFGFNSCEAVLDGLAPFGDTAALVTGLECVVFIYANWDVVEYKLDDIKNLFYDFGADVKDIAEGMANGIIDAIKSLFTKVEEKTDESIDGEGTNNVDYEVSDKVWKEVGKKKIKGLKKKFENAADKGIVGPRGQEGIKEVKGFKYKGKTYDYEMKIKGKVEGDFRIFGNKNADGVIEFTKFGNHK